MAAEAPDIPAAVGFSELLRSSWRIFTSLLGRLFGLMFTIALIELAATIGARLLVGQDADSFGVALFGIAPLTLQIVLSSLAVGWGATVVADWLAGQSASTRAALAANRPLWKELLAAALMATLAAMFALLILQGAILFIFTLFFGPPIVAQVISLEAKPLQVALPRARQLGRGQLGRVFSYLLGISLGLGLLQALLPALIASSVQPLGDLGQVIVFIAISGVTAAIALTFFAVVTTVAYFDLRARLEDYGPEDLKSERGPLGS
jgi:hypothetical protein